MSRRFFVFILILYLAAPLYSCGRSGKALTDAEAAAITEICGVDASLFKNVTGDVLTKRPADKFTAVSKVFEFDNMLAFIVKPIAYNGPITLALVINSTTGESVGLRIVEHVETLHYVRDMQNTWFIERFIGKSASEYLTLVRLNAHEEREIVAITGATVTTQAIINGVNAAFGAFQEYKYGSQADDVPYMVRFEPGQGDGPVETGSVSIRAYGVVIAEISIDEIRALPAAKRAMSIHSSAGVTQHNFRGTLLSNVLALVDSNIVEQYERVLAVGVDDYSSGIDMDEVRDENNVFIMYEDNDLPLEKKNGEPGAMRVVVINDIFGQRFTNYLLEIVLESEVIP